MHDTAAHRVTRWTLRLIVIGYVFFLVVWPVSLVEPRPSPRPGTCSTHCRPPGVLRPPADTVGRLVGGRDQHGVRCRHLAAAGALRVPGRRALSALIDVPLSVSPVVVGLALVLVYNGRAAGSARSRKAGRTSDHLSTPRHDHGDGFVACRWSSVRSFRCLPRSATTRSRRHAASALGLQTFRRITLPSNQVGRRLRRRALPRAVPR